MQIVYSLKALKYCCRIAFSLLQTIIILLKHQAFNSTTVKMAWNMHALWSESIIACHISFQAHWCLWKFWCKDIGHLTIDFHHATLIQMTTISWNQEKIIGLLLTFVHGLRWSAWLVGKICWSYLTLISVRLKPLFLFRSGTDTETQNGCYFWLIP